MPSPARNPLSRFYPGYVFDLDGTIYLSDACLPGAVKLIAQLRQVGARTVFVSNNPTFTRIHMAEKLRRLGIPVALEEVINSSFVLVQYLSRIAPGCTVFAIGEPSLESELEEAGFRLTDQAQNIDYVIASFDRTFVYRKLQIAFDALRAGARFVATNADRYCPVAGGGEPDAASMIAAVEACTEHKVELVVGKPSQLMAQTALDVLGLSAPECLLTGDRLETDIVMGLQAGMDTALVMTGATQRSQVELSTIQPTYIIEHLSELIPNR